ncbi:MAG: hypothetical protein ABI416_12505 [Ginsengibacter sp.]
MRLKRIGAAGRGALQGGLIGLAAGTIAGLALGGDPVLPTKVQNSSYGSYLNSVYNLLVV